VNNGQSVVTLNCDASAKVADLYYQSSASAAPGGAICVGSACAASICPHSSCWGDTVTTPYTVDGITAFISDLSADFSWYFDRVGGISGAYFSTGGWTAVNSGGKQIQLSYTRSQLLSVTMQSILTALSEVTLVPSTWYQVIAVTDGGTTGTSTLDIIVRDPSQKYTDKLGGFIDILFFQGVSTNPGGHRCLIHDTCSYYSSRYHSCYTYTYHNLVGEYSNDNHVHEGACLNPINSAWGYTTVTLNAQRTGGTYRMMCDSTCTVCKGQGNFNGDDCTCYDDIPHSLPGGIPYYCISIKFASAGFIAPSIIFALFSLVFLLF